MPFQYGDFVYKNLNRKQINLPPWILRQCSISPVMRAALIVLAKLWIVDEVSLIECRSIERVVSFKQHHYFLDYEPVPSDLILKTILVWS